METLIFHGVIQDGIHRHSELYVPGRSEIAQASEDWPRALCKGSLNVGIRSDGYPAIFPALGLPNQVSSLDEDCFPCPDGGWDVDRRGASAVARRGTWALARRGTWVVARPGVGTATDGLDGARTVG